MTEADFFECGCSASSASRRPPRSSLDRLEYAQSSNLLSVRNLANENAEDAEMSEGAEYLALQEDG